MASVSDVVPSGAASAAAVVATPVLRILGSVRLYRRTCHGREDAVESLARRVHLRMRDDERRVLRPRIQAVEAKRRGGHMLQALEGC